VRSTLGSRGKLPGERKPVLIDDNDDDDEDDDVDNDRSQFSSINIVCRLWTGRPWFDSL